MKYALLFWLLVVSAAPLAAQRVDDRTSQVPAASNAESKSFWQSIDLSKGSNQIMLALGVGSLILAHMVFRKIDE